MYNQLIDLSQLYLLSAVNQAGVCVYVSARRYPWPCSVTRFIQPGACRQAGSAPVYIKRSVAILCCLSCFIVTVCTGAHVSLCGFNSTMARATRCLGTRKTVNNKMLE
jgi:hypothetical protein